MNNRLKLIIFLIWLALVVEQIQLTALDHKLDALQTNCVETLKGDVNI